MNKKQTDTNPDFGASTFREDIPLDLARAAHRGTSHDPDIRGLQEIDAYAGTLARDLAAMEALAGDDEWKLELLAIRWARYRAGYRTRTIAQLEAKSRCVSTMIAGPSKFNHARAAKANDAEQKRYLDRIEFRQRELDAMQRDLTPEDQPIKAGAPDAVEQLAAKVSDLETKQARMVATNKAIRTSAKRGPDAQVAALEALGYGAAHARELLKPDFAGRVGFADYEIKNNAANIRRLKKRLEAVSTAKVTPDVIVEGVDDIRMEESPADNRVRLFFPGKPGQEVRSALKAAGFRWAPTSGCWQGYHNHKSLSFAREFVAGARFGKALVQGESL